jgi:putative ABC transport system substrate-binding protein
MIAERLQLLKELLPSLKRVAIIIRSGDPGLEKTLLDIRRNADRLGLEVFDFAVTTGISIKLAFMHLQNDRCEAIYLASGPLGPAKRAQIIKNAAEARLPAIYSHGEFTVGGGLMSFGADDRDLFHRAATFVDRILKGAKPADLSVEPPTKFRLAINLNVATGLGLTVPQSLRARAEMIE